MNRSMFQRLGSPQPTRQQQPQQPDMNKLFKQFSQNPAKYLPGIPQGMTDPYEMLKFYADNGKVPPIFQQKVNAMLGRR